MNEFIRLCRTKRNLKRLCEFVLSNIARASANCRNYFKKLQQESLVGNGTYSDGFDQDDVQWDDILSNKKSPFTDVTEDMWRPSPNPERPLDAVLHYIPNFFIEERLDESALHKGFGILPLLSRKAIEEIAKGDQLDSEELAMMEMLAKTIKEK